MDVFLITPAYDPSGGTEDGRSTFLGTRAKRAPLIVKAGYTLVYQVEGSGRGLRVPARLDRSKADKQNVRDGHYPIGGSLHFFTNVSAGVPVSPAAQAFVSAVVVPNVAQQLVDAFAPTRTPTP